MLVTPSQPRETLATRILTHHREYTGNPMGPVFNRVFNGYDRQKKIDTSRNFVGQGASSITDDTPSMGGVLGSYQPALGNGTVDANAVRDAIADNQIQLYWRKNRERNRKYRTICKRTEIEEGLNHIINEAIDSSSMNEIASLYIDPDSGITDTDELARLNKIFRLEMLKDVLDFKFNAKNWMYSLLVDGRLFLEVSFDENKTQVLGVQQLPSANMIVIVQDGLVIGYRQMLVNSYSTTLYKDGKGYVDYDPDQILYCDLGERFYDSGGINDIRSILEPAIKPYHQLNTIEDAVVMYRLLWGSEKLMFKIDVSGMPPMKAERHLKEQEKRFSRRIDYDTSLGMISSPTNVIGLSEHFYLPITDYAKSSSIERLKGGENLGNIDDLKFFKQNLVASMHVPFGRITSLASGDEKYTSGKIGEVTQAEVAFARMVSGYVCPLGNILRDLFVMMLNTKPWISDERKKSMYYDVIFTKTNSFQEWIDADILAKRLEITKGLKELIKTKQNPDGFIPAKEAAFLGMKITAGEWGKWQEEIKVAEKEADDEGAADTAPAAPV